MKQSKIEHEKNLFCKELVSLPNGFFTRRKFGVKMSENSGYFARFIANKSPMYYREFIRNTSNPEFEYTLETVESSRSI